MLANYLIGLREGLEMALIVTILIAYVVKVGRKDVLSKLWVGVGIALVVPLGIGALLTWGPYGLSFQAQEIVGGGLSVVAVAFVTWMIFWMGKTARSMKTLLHEKLDSVLVGAGWGVVILAMLSVGREGIETALFVWATVDSVGGGWEPFVGALLGLLTAAVLGFLLYRGMVRINLGTFFAWTGAFLILVAGGVLAYGIGDLQEAGVIPGAGIHAYDISAAIPASSWYGTVLAGAVNFNPSPTWLQVIAWFGYIIVVSFFYVRAQRTAHRKPAKAEAPGATSSTPVAS
ncbi:iron uptake transporter permease EfeU [Leifsonia aquatica]|uniref:High-affinity iron transporter n=2 Tax=Leifsonia aquatica TaxID=144185 RepID=A0A7W4UW79_LEIAQ|nr:iron uptake transporter permease EfeU [Leifsonia aquatica]ERK71475.1 putative ferrous iron permease EfeU [Leifsonia aquatica ATCC 14665]MBB2966903.1 high-affinity iron transporter [Leifsonia aquatica]